MLNRDLMVNKFLFAAILILTSGVLRSQVSEDYLVVTIVQEKKKGNHKLLTDYWLISLDKWKQSQANDLVPLYMYGLSDQDVVECTSDELIFFNASSEETFLNSYAMKDKFLELVTKERIKISTTINRKASGSTKTKVYFTRVRGVFIYCKFKNLSFCPIGYCGNKIAMPVQFEIMEVEEKLVSRIKEYPFYTLPLVGLHTIQ